MYIIIISWAVFVIPIIKIENYPCVDFYCPFTIKFSITNLRRNGPSD